MKYLSDYLSELALQSYELIPAKPSIIAAACVSLARRTLGIRRVWHQALVHYTGYAYEDIAQYEHRIWCLHKEAPTMSLQAVRKKYLQQAFFRVASIDALP